MFDHVCLLEICVAILQLYLCLCPVPFRPSPRVIWRALDLRWVSILDIAVRTTFSQHFMAGWTEALGFLPSIIA